MITIAIANNKGGVGKTTTTLHPAHHLAETGYQTLLIDLDGQANLTQAILGTEATGPDMTHLFRDALPIQRIAAPVLQNLWFAPASPGLNDVQDSMATKPMQLFRLRTALESANWDICLIDCPPNLGPLTYSALIAATHLIIPTEPAGWSIDGLQRTSDLLIEMRREIGHAPFLLGTVVTKLQETILAHRTGMQVLRNLGVPILATIPRRDGQDAYQHIADAYQPLAAAMAALLDRQEN